MIEKFCPECLDYTYCEPITFEKTYDVRGERITINAHFLKCHTCNDIIPDKEMQERNLNTVYSEYRKKKKLLEPGEIEELRNKYDLSQRQFAKILGWSHATLSRYENGVLQSINHNNELVLLQDPKNMLLLIEVNSDNLPEQDYKTIKKKVVKVLEQSKTKTLKDFLFSMVKSESEVPNIFNGYNTFELDKLVNTIKFFANHDTNLYKVKLMKYLWYSDFLNFKRYTVSINGLKYVNFKMGPVPDVYDHLLMMALGEETGIHREYIYFTGGVGELFTSNNSFDPDVFTSEELDTLHTILKELIPHTGASVSELSHKEFAWIETSEKDLISYDYAKRLSIN